VAAPAGIKPLVPGNIDLHKRPVVRNADGTISTVRSMSTNIDGREVLLPTVSDDGKILSDDDAVALYRRTGKHLGMFGTPDEATAFAKRLHEDQAAEYGGEARPTGSSGWRGAPEVEATAAVEPQPQPEPVDWMTAVGRTLGQGATANYGDEASGLVQALGEKYLPESWGGGGAQAQRKSLGDLYRGTRGAAAQENRAAEEKLGPVLSALTNAAGGMPLAIATAGKGKGLGAMLKGGALLGGAYGLGGSQADLTRGEFGRAGLDTGLGSLFGMAGAGAGYGLEKGVGAGARWLAGKAPEALKNIAGWLKVNSLHPTPLKAEAMASLPGGVPAVGREVLERGIGGLTKAGTARQADAATSQAGQAVSKIAGEYDKLGGKPLDIGDAIDAAKVKAKELFDEPTTRAAGERLATLIEQYEATFGQARTATATQALAMKRALAKAAYGAGQELEKTGNTIAGTFGEGMAAFERSVDDVMDRSLGPQFEAANLAFRRLLGASNAAERTAARQDANLMALGLQNLSGGTLGASIAGTPGAAAGLLATTLLRKYGAQAGARTLHGLGGLLEAAPRLAPMMSGSLAAPAGPAASRGAARLSDMIAPEIEAKLIPLLLQGMGQRQEPQPALATVGGRR